MVMGAEVIHHPIPAVLDVQYQCSPLDAPDFPKTDDMVDLSSPPILGSTHSEIGADTSLTTVLPSEPALMCFVPIIRSGSYSDIGPRSYMEDEHLRIDDLSAHLGSLIQFPSPCSFYGVFDGHGGPEAAAFVRKNAIRLFFKDVDFPQALQVDDIFLAELEDSLHKSFLVADLALADDSTINASSGTTALTALIFGRHLLVANVGDCRAVLCRKGEAVDMSQDHRPNYDAELRRIEVAGGYVEDGYLNGVLSVARALGDWDLKLPRGSSSPLIAEPEFRQTYLTEDDEFLIIGCDGIWDVMSSQEAVGVVRRGLRRHDDPAQCARELVMEALRLKTADNLTVIVVCFSSDVESDRFSECRGSSRLRCCAFSSEALCRLKSLLEGDDWRT